MAKEKILNPELFFCLAGPVGVNLDAVTRVLSEQLRLFDYQAEIIHITDILPSIIADLGKKLSSLAERYDKYIKASNWLRSQFDDDSIMAVLSFFLIQEARKRRSGGADVPAPGTAYIIRQLKRPEEIRLYRQIYGKQVFQISAYADPDLRKARLAEKMRDSDSSRTRAAEFEHLAVELLNRDENEVSVDHGQRVRDVFPLGDVFIDARNDGSIKSTLERFIKIVFGYNFHSPTREEYGMYIAKSASLRSSDLSRQVGAAIFSSEGHVKTLGCNEVPSPKGGTYWEGDEGDSREFVGGSDTNDQFRYRLLSDVLKNFAAVGVVEKKFSEMPSREFLKQIKDMHGVRLEKSLLMMDIIEYGRIIHAEMNAITDAARKGISLEFGTLFCTTFPCHICAKHIISSGIDKVVYIEPYPKSYAKELYKEEIVLGRSNLDLAGKVRFEPFIGISPYRYRELFERSKRKKEDGSADPWQSSVPRPNIEVYSTEYLDHETDYLKVLIQQFAEKDVLLPGAKLTS